MFLSWESPWPAHSGAALRSLGMLKELSKAFEVELILLTRRPLTEDQMNYLKSISKNITRIPLKDISAIKKMYAALRMIKKNLPYHSALLESSLQDYYNIQSRILTYKGIVFTSTGHWGTLVYNKEAPNWILNQCDADAEFWRVYASQVSSPYASLMAKINYRFAIRHYKQIYKNVARIISVCEEDRQHTSKLSPQAQVDVIENGVDCSYYNPERTPRTGPPRLLFTGTSVPRNVTALRQFTHSIWPMIQRELPEVELWIAGNFRPEAQVEFRKYKSIHFTGAVEDMRPYFNQSDVFIAPFEKTHGSKLKIAEAMAMGIAIVSTPQGIRGFQLIDGESVLIAYSNEQFAAHVVKLSRDHILGEQLGKAARNVAIATIDWSVLGQRLKAIIEETYANLQAD